MSKSSKVFGDIANEISVSMDSYFKEQNKKVRAEKAEWKKVALGGRQIYCFKTGKMYRAKANHEFLFSVWTHPDGKRMLNVDGLSYTLAESRLCEFMRKVSYVDSQKIAKLREQIRKLNKRFDKIVEKAFKDGEQVTVFPTNAKEIKSQ